MKHFTHDNSHLFSIINGRGFYHLDKCVICLRVMEGFTIYAHDKCWHSLSDKLQRKVMDEFDPFRYKEHVGKQIEFKLED